MKHRMTQLFWVELILQLKTIDRMWRGAAEARPEIQARR